MDRRFTEEEARQIFALAAERDHAARTTDERLLTLEELEEAAQAAGIDPVHVRGAAGDFLRPGRRVVQRSFLGMPVEMQQMRLLAVPPSDQLWAATVEACQAVFGKEGSITEAGSVYAWSSDERDTPVQVTMEPAEEGTRVTVEHRTWPRALGATLGTVLNVAVGLVLLTVWLTSAAEGMLLPALVLLAFSAVFGVGWLVKLRRAGHRQETAFGEVLDRVGRAAASDAAEGARRDALTPEVEEETAAPLALDEAETEGGPEAPAARRRVR